MEKDYGVTGISTPAQRVQIEKIVDRIGVPALQRLFHFGENGGAMDWILKREPNYLTDAKRIIGFFDDVNLDNLTYYGVRVPLCHESPEDVIAQIDPSLKYAGKTFDGSNRVYQVTHEGKPAILKVASAPARVKAFCHREHEFLKKLTEAKAKGFPKAHKFYNSSRQVSAADYTPLKFSAVLKDFVEGETFHEQLRTPEDYRKVRYLGLDLSRICDAGLPNDFKGGQLIVTPSKDVFLIDLEELGGPGNIEERVNSLYRDNVAEHYDRKISRHPVLQRVVEQADSLLETSIVNSLAKFKCASEPLPQF